MVTPPDTPSTEVRSHDTTVVILGTWNHVGKNEVRVLPGSISTVCSEIRELDLALVLRSHGQPWN